MLLLRRPRVGRLMLMAMMLIWSQVWLRGYLRLGYLSYVMTVRWLLLCLLMCLTVVVTILFVLRVARLV